MIDCCHADGNSICCLCFPQKKSNLRWANWTALKFVIIYLICDWLRESAQWTEATFYICIVICLIVSSPVRVQNNITVRTNIPTSSDRLDNCLLRIEAAVALLFLHKNNSILCVNHYYVSFEKCTNKCSNNLHFKESTTLQSNWKLLHLIYKLQSVQFLCLFAYIILFCMQMLAKNDFFFCCFICRSQFQQL